MTVHQPVAGNTAAAAAAWLRDHGDVLYAYALSRLRNPDAAEELVQDTLLAAMQAVHRFEGQSSIRTWLIGIMRNKLLEHFRRQQKQPVSLDVDAELPIVVVEREFTKRGKWKIGPKKWGGEFASNAERDDFRIVMRDCLAKLPERTALAFTLAECDDVPVDKLQQALGIRTANHVYVLLHRARAALRQCLEHNWFERSEGGT